MCPPSVVITNYTKILASLKPNKNNSQVIVWVKRGNSKRKRTKFWVWYVDDVFVIVPNRFRFSRFSKFSKFYVKLNKIYKRIRTVNPIKSTQLVFLNVLVIKKNNFLEFHIYWKPAPSDNYIRNDSFATPEYNIFGLHKCVNV